MNTLRRNLFFGFMALALAALAACSNAQPQTPVPPTSRLTEAEAAAMLNNALQALNTGDYAAWSQNWSDDMKAAIKEPDFLAYRDQVLQAYGAYQAIETMELLPGVAGPDYVRWSAVAGFEKGKLRFNFGFQRDGDQIVGVHPEPVE